MSTSLLSEHEVDDIPLTLKEVAGQIAFCWTACNKGKGRPPLAGQLSLSRKLLDSPPLAEQSAMKARAARWAAYSSKKFAGQPTFESTPRKQ